MALSLARLIAEIKSLQTKADSLTQARDNVVARTHELMAELSRAAARPRPGRPKKTRGPGRPRKTSKLKGRRVPPKYRGPDGSTWSGRGMTPVWLRDAVKKGKKRDDFLIKRRAK